MSAYALIPYDSWAELGDPFIESILCRCATRWVWARSGVAGRPRELMDELESIMLGVEATDWGDRPWSRQRA